MAGVNFRKERSNNVSSYVRDRMKFGKARYLGKTYLVRKFKKKNGYREFDHRGILICASEDYCDISISLSLLLMLLFMPMLYMSSEDGISIKCSLIG